MGVLINSQHERFAQGVVDRVIAGAKTGAARTAAYIEIYGEKDKPPAPNARRLANNENVKARIAELTQIAADLADCTRGWCVLELKRRIKDYNIDDYLTPPNLAGERFFDISRCSREQLGRLSELAMEEEILDAGAETMTRVRKIKIKPYDPVSAIARLSAMLGFDVVQKHELTGKDGGPIKTSHIADLTDDQLAAIAAGKI